MLRFLDATFFFGVSFCYIVIVVVNSNKIQPNTLNAIKTEKIKFTIIL